MGFVFTRAADISGIDLDHCRDAGTGEIDAWAKTILDSVKSYSEISPSGEGVHIILKGQLPAGVDGKRKELHGDGYRPKAAIEMYSAGRYFTMTGNTLPGYSQAVEARQDELIAIYEEFFGKVESDPNPDRQKARKPSTGEKKKDAKPEPPHESTLPDEAIIARMLSGINADEIEALFTRGDTSAYGGDDSSADLALCNHLAFWTGKDRQRMDSIFRQSKLMRPKWDEKRGNTTYGEITIGKACQGTKEVYQVDPGAAVEKISLPDGVRKWDDELPLGAPGVDKDGVTYCKSFKKDRNGEETIKKVDICDGYAFISEETRDEHGEASFTVEGRGSKDGHVFKFDITGRDFSDDRKLKAALVAHFGARNRLKQLEGDKIQRLTRKVTKLTLITSPRWIEGKLAVPGVDEDGFKFRLNPRVPADLSTGEEKMGLAALKLILETWPKEKAAILICSALASPMCGGRFPGDRFGLALVGTSGRGLKTEALKHALAIYGAGFLSEESLLRWGEGATNNAMLSIASACGCLPVGIDNYKGTHRDGPSKFVSVVHTILEGRERERLNRNAELRETREYASTLLVTGEDLPEEASTVARLLPWEWSSPPNTDQLTELQQIAHHLPAVGRLWCRHLSNGTEVDMDAWRKSRAELVKVAEAAGAINPGRIGTTAAIMKLVWKTALTSPFGEVLAPYTQDFEKGLASLIQTTAEAAQEATEASKFVDTLKELISSGRCIIRDQIDTGQEITLSGVIGWRLKDPDKDAGGVAVLPKLAMEAVRRVDGPQAQSIGPKTLYRQLEEAGMIAEGSGKGQRLAVKRVGSKTARVLVFKPGILIDDGVLDEVDLSKAAAYAKEDIYRRKQANNLQERIHQAVSCK